ncbi:MAG: cytochrome c-type biosis protein CcmH [Solirubrobacteraceae bacterium]|nr:cytochrome c-type biosis protein CcmH [Solirubrobacteraceae bacterium]
MHRQLRAAALTFALLALPTSTVAAAPPQPRASLPDVEDEVMCVVCGVPLNEATDAPQANRERAEIRRLIARGQTKGQIKRALRDEFGPEVLGLPERKGFNLAAYLVPVGAVAAALIALALLVPRWLRRRPSGAAAADEAPELDPGDARRLERDLARYDR